MISLWGLFGGASNNNNNNASAHASSPSNNGRGGVGTSSSSSSSSQSALLRAAFGESLDALMIEATRHKDGSLLRECIFAAQSRPLLDAHDVFHALMVSCEELRRHKSSRPLLLRSLSDVCKLISLNLMPLDAQDIHAACNVVRRLAWCVESTTPTPSSSPCVGTQQQQQQTKQKQTLSLSGTSTPPPAPPSSSSTSSTTPTPTTTHAAALRCNDGLRVSLIANDDGILTRCVQLIVSLVSACSVEHVAYGELVGVLMIVFAASPAQSMAEATCAAAMCQQTHVLCAALRDYTGDEDGRGGVPSSTTNNNNSSLTRQTCVSSYVKDLCAIIAGEEPSRISLMIPRMAEHNSNNNINIKSASPTTTTTTLARGLGTGPLSTPQRLAAAHASELNSTTAAWVLPGATPRDELHNTSMAATTTTTCADGVMYRPNFRLRRHLIHCLVLFFSEPRTQGRRGADDVGVDERVCAHLINPILLRCIDTCIIGLALKTPEELAGSPSSSSSTSLAASTSATHVVASSSNNNNNNNACSFLSPSEAAEMFSQTQRLAALVAEHYAANMRGAITRWIHFHHRLTQQQQQQQQQTSHVSEEMHHRPTTSSCVVAMIAAAWAPVVAKPHVLNELLTIKTTRPFTLQHDDHDDEVMDEEDVVVMVLAMKMMQLLTNGDAYTPEDDKRPTIKQTTTTTSSSSSLMLVDQQRLDVLEFIEQFGRGLVEVLAKLPRGISRDDFAQHLTRVDACMQHLINAHLEATTSSSSSSTYCMTGDDEVYRARLLHADSHYLRASMLLQLPSMHAHIDVYVRTLMVPPVEMFAPLLLSTPTHTSSTSPTTTQAEGMINDVMSAAPTTTSASGDGVAARATRITQQAVQRFTSTFARKPLTHEEGGSATPTSSTTFTGVVATTTTSVHVLDASRRMYAIGRAASTLRLHISMCSILLRTCLCCGHEQQQQQQQRQGGWMRLVRGLLQVDLIDARVNWLMKYAAVHQRAMKKSGTNNNNSSNNNNNRRDDVGVGDVAASWVKLDGVLRDAHEAAHQLTTDWWSFCVNGAEDGCIDAMECMWGEMVQEMKKIPSHTHTDGASTTTSTSMDDDDDDDDAHVAAYFSAMCACEVSRRCTWMSQSLVLALLAALTSTAPVAGRVWSSWRHLAHHTCWHLHHPTIKNNTQTSIRATTNVMMLMMSSTRRAPPSSLPAALREALTLDPLEARRRSTTNMLAMIASLATLFTRAMASHRAREDAVSVDDVDDARHQPTSSTLMASAFADTDVMKRWMSFTGSQRRFPAAALDDVLHQLCSAPCELMMQAQHEALRLWGGNDEDEDEEELATVNLDDDDDQDHLDEVLHDKHHSVAAHTTYTNTAIIVHQRLDISAQLIQHVFQLIQSCGGEIRNQCWLFLLRLLRDAAVEMPIFLQRLTHKQHDDDDDDDGDDDLHLADGEVERLCNRAMDALTLAFRAVEATHHNCITHLDVHTLRELMMAIGAFVRLPTPTPTMESRTFINLTAVQMLWAMADYVALSRRTKQHNNNNNSNLHDDDDDDGDDDVLMAHDSTTIPLSDDDVLWCTLMIQLQDGSMDVRQEVRQSSLSSLFAITQAHGAHFSAECWSCLLLGVFVELMEATMAAVEASSSSSITTTEQQAFTNTTTTTTTTTTNTSTKRLASPHPPPSSSHTNVSSMDETSVARRDFLRAITLAPRKELEEMRIAIMDGIARCIIHHMDDMRRGLRSVEHIKENTSDVDDDDDDDDDEDLLTEMLLLLVDVCGQTRVVLKGGSAEKCALAAVYALYGLMHEVDVLPPRVRQRAWAVMELLVQESITDDDADASTRRGTTTSTSPATMAVVAAIVAALSSDYVGRLRIAGEPAMEDLSAAILAASRTHPLHDEHKLDHEDVVVDDDDDDACIDGASLATYQRYVGLLRMCMRCPAVLQSFYFPNRVQVAMADGLRDVCERLAPRAAQHTLRTLMSLQFPSKQHNTSTSREEESEWRPGAGPSVLVMWLNLLRTLMMDGVQADDDVGTHAKKKKKHQQRHVEMQELLLADAVELITRVLLVGFTTTSLSAEVSSDCTDILHEILAHVMSDAVNDADDDDATSTRASAAGIRRVDAAIEAVQRSAEDLLHASTAALRRQRSEPEYQHDDDDDAPPSSSQKRTSLAVAMEEFGCVMDGLRELLLWRKQHTHDEDVAQHHHHRHHHPSWKEVLASSTQLLQRILHETSHAGIEAVELRDRCRSILRACDVDAHTTASASSSTMDHRVVLLEDLIHNYRERIDDASTHAALLEYITELEDDLVELSPSLRWELVERLLPLMSGGATSEVARSADGLAREHMMKQEVEKTLRMIHSYLRT